MKKSTKSRAGGKRAGAGRKPIGAEPGVTFSVKIPAEMARQVDDARPPQSRGELVRELLARWLKRKR